MLASSPRPLTACYDLAALDLDGVVYVGQDAVPDAPDHLAGARAAGLRLAFVTNNASRPAREVAEHLTRLGVQADDADVVTSSQAAAGLLADRLAKGSRIYLIGGAGLEEALSERGLVAVTTADDHPVAVVQGYGPDMPWRQVVAGAVLVRDGLPWVATNTDMTFPTPAGLGPGNGALVRLVADFAEREPEVAGKPSPPLLRETLQRVGGTRPLFVGDRLDTDILGAHNVGWDSLLVLTGVTGLKELAAAPPAQRPTYLAEDLAGLLEAHAEPEIEGDRVALGGWHADAAAGRLEIMGTGSTGDWWRVAATTAWLALDATGAMMDLSAVSAPDGSARVR